MKFRTSIILLVVLFLLLTWAVYVNKRLPARETNSSGSQIISGHEYGNVKRLIIYNAQEYIVMERQGDGWKTKAPRNFDADPVKVKDFIKRSFNLFYIRKLVDGLGDLSSFRLKTKRDFVVFSYLDGGGDTLFLGTVTPRGSWYIKKNSEPFIYTVNKEYGGYFKKPVSEWRMKRIASFRASDVIQLKIRNKNKTFTCTKDTAGFEWHVAGSRKCTVDNEKVFGFMKFVLKTEAIGIIEKAQKVHKFNKLLMNATFRTADEVVSIDVGGKLESGSCYVKRKDKNEIFIMPGAFVDAMAKVGDLLCKKTPVRE